MFFRELIPHAAKFEHRLVEVGEDSNPKIIKTKPVFLHMEFRDLSYSQRKLNTLANTIALGVPTLAFEMLCKTLRNALFTNIFTSHCTVY